MAEVSGYTKEKMDEINNSTVVGGEVIGDNLVLTTRDGTEIVAGDVRGPQGPMGDIAEVGDLAMSARSAKTGFLLCNGASYLRSAYPDLFAEIGVKFGAVDGTHFNVPDYRDRFPIGASTTVDVGETGGEAAHVLTQSEMPGHDHPLAPSTVGQGIAGQNQISVAAGSGATVIGAPFTGFSSLVTGQRGGSGPFGAAVAHNNLPPFLGMNFFIKY